MTETLDPTPSNQFNTQELAEVIYELEQYRERLLSETLATAQRAKLLKSQVMAQLEPDLNKIDAMLQELRQQQAVLTESH